MWRIVKVHARAHLNNFLGAGGRGRWRFFPAGGEAQDSGSQVPANLWNVGGGGVKFWKTPDTIREAKNLIQKYHPTWLLSHPALKHLVFLEAC